MSNPAIDDVDGFRKQPLPANMKRLDSVGKC